MRFVATSLALAATFVLAACGDDSASNGSAPGGAGGANVVAAGSGGEVSSAGGNGQSMAGNGGSAQGGQSGSAGSAGATAMPDSGSAGSSVISDAGNVDAPAPAKSVCPAGPFPAPVVGASQNLCTGFKFNYTFNEGPTWIAGQNAFFFSNFLQGQAMHGDIVKYTPGGSCEIFITDVGCNGLAVSPDGNLLAACHQSRSVVKFDVVTKQPTTLADMYMGKMLDTPNDLVAHSKGSIYFTNPTYELQGRPVGVGMAVFWRNPAGALTALAMGGMPNGIALSPDEKKLYVIGAGQWDVDDNGTPSNKQNSFVTGDGMAVDCAGNVYSSLGTIRNPQGNSIGTFPQGTNLAFGGADGKTLFVVGGNTNVRSYAMNLPGLP
jgi:gluconolactonase